MQAVDIDKVSGDYAGLPLDIAYKLVQEHMQKYVRIIGVSTPYNKWKHQDEIARGRTAGIQ